MQARIDQFQNQLNLFHKTSFREFTDLPNEFTIYDLRFLIALRDWTKEFTDLPIVRFADWGFWILDLRFKIAFSYCSN